MSFPKIIVMTTKKVFSPLYAQRLNNYQEAIIYAKSRFEGCLATRSFIGTGGECKKDEIFIVSFSKWESEQSMNIWDTSHLKCDIHREFWMDLHRQQINIETNIVSPIICNELPLL